MLCPGKSGVNVNLEVNRIFSSPEGTLGVFAGGAITANFSTGKCQVPNAKCLFRMK